MNTISHHQPSLSIYRQVENYTDEHLASTYQQLHDQEHFSLTKLDSMFYPVNELKGSVIGAAEAVFLQYKTGISLSKDDVNELAVYLQTELGKLCADSIETRTTPGYFLPWKSKGRSRAFLMAAGSSELKQERAIAKAALLDKLEIAELPGKVWYDDTLTATTRLAQADDDEIGREMLYRAYRLMKKDSLGLPVVTKYGKLLVEPRSS